ncbi:hypothetical protein RFI_19331, partial [Reticulomyxa filosa]
SLLLRRLTPLDETEKTLFRDYIGSEFVRRWNEMSEEWRRELTKHEPNEIRRNKEICVYAFDRKAGLGNRFYRMSQIYYVSYINQCILGIHLGWNGCGNISKDDANIFGAIWNDDYNNGNNVYTTGWYSPWRKEDKYSNNIFTFENIFEKYGNTPVVELEQFFKIPNTIFWGNTSSPIHISHYPPNQYFGNLSFFDNYTYSSSSIIYLKDPDINDDKIFLDIRYDGHMQYMPITRFYGLLVTQLKSLFRDIAVRFIQKHFTNSFVIGVHIRTGNGEKMNRPTLKKNEIIKQLNISIGEIIKWQSLTKQQMECKIKLFIATDSEKIIELIRNASFDLLTKYCNKSSIHTIISLKQIRPPQGHGHVFTSNSQQHVQLMKRAFSNDPNTCILGVVYPYLDMELLGFTDFLLLPVQSTFTRLSSLLIIKRRKSICRAVFVKSKRLHQYHCKNFHSQQTHHFIIPSKP